jgi:uncharacterized membrane protein
MNSQMQIAPAFRRNALRPVVCLRVGWHLIRDQYWLYLGMAAVAILGGGMAPLGLLMAPLLCGVYLSLDRHAHGRRAEIGDLTLGFEFFVPAVIATLIQAIPGVAIMLPVIVVFIGIFFVLLAGTGPSHDPSSFANNPVQIVLFAVLMFLVILALVIALSMFFVFTYPLIVHERLSGLDAVKTSIRAVLGNLIGVCGLLSLITIIGLVGALFCYAGAVLFMPVALASWHAAYRQVFVGNSES